MSEAITVPVVLPPSPTVLVSQAFVATLAEVEQRVAGLTIVDAPTSQVAADLQVRLTRAGRELEKAREAVKAPFLAAGRQIDAAAAVPAARISRALDSVKRAQISWDQKQREAAAAAERARLAELARLERVRQEEERERQRKADEAAAAARKAEEERQAKEKQAAEAAAKAGVQAESLDLAPSEDLDLAPPDAPAEKTDTEKQIDALRFAPAPVAEKAVGITFRTRLRIKSTDVTKVPDNFIIKRVDEQMLREAFCFGWREDQPIPEVPGVVFEVERTPVDTGRGVF